MFTKLPNQIFHNIPTNPNLPKQTDQTQHNKPNLLKLLPKSNNSLASQILPRAGHGSVPACLLISYLSFIYISFILSSFFSCYLFYHFISLSLILFHIFFICLHFLKNFLNFSFDFLIKQVLPHWWFYFLFYDNAVKSKDN